MILTKKDLKDRVADMDSKDICFALIWTKDEFDGYFDGHKISNHEWDCALNCVDAESEEHSIKESIESEIQTIIDEKENE